MRPKHRAGLLAAALLLSLPSSASAAVTLTVDPADGNNACNGTDDLVCKTISQAAGVAADGDTIAVKPGTYAENVTFDAPNLTVTGGADVKVTGTGSGDVITVTGANTKLSDLLVDVAPGGGSALRTTAKTTVTGTSFNRAGSSTVTDPVVDAAGETLLQKTFTINQAGAIGAPAISGAALTLEDSLLLSSVGPGVVVTGGAVNKIVRSTIAGTEATSAESDGVRFSSTAAGDRALQIDSSIVVGGALAAALRTTSGAPSGTVKVGVNHATLYGVANGIVLDSSDATGILNQSYGNLEATVNATIVRGKSTAENYDGLLVLAPNTVKATFTNSDATAMDPVGTPAGITVTQGAGNQGPTADAQTFGGSLHLRADAPLIDKGGPVVDGESATDVDGQPRSNGGATDIGADEYYNNKPKVTFTAPEGGLSGQPLTFSATFADDPGDTATLYAWDFGDGGKTQTDQAAVQHTYAAPGTYTVQVAVVDRANAVSDIVSGTVTVKDGAPPEVKITTPKQGAKLKLNKKKKKGAKKKPKPLPLTAIGTDSDASGIAKIEVALTKRSGGCRQYTGSSLKKAGCTAYRWQTAKLTGDAWSFTTKRGVRLTKGTYELRVRGTDRSNNMTTAFTAAAKTLVKFRVK